MLYAFFWVIPRHLNFICRRFGTLLFHLHRQVVVWGMNYVCECWGIIRERVSLENMEHTGCSETSAHKIQTPRNNPEEGIQYFELNRSLYSLLWCTVCRFMITVKKIVTKRMWRKSVFCLFQVSSSEYFSVSFESGVLAAGGDDRVTPSDEFVPATKGTLLSWVSTQRNVNICDYRCDRLVSTPALCSGKSWFRISSQG